MHLDSTQTCCQNDLKQGRDMSHRSLSTGTNRSVATGVAPRARLHKELLPVLFLTNNCCIFPSPRSTRLPRPSNFLPKSTLGSVSSKPQVLTAGNHRQSGSPFQLPLYDLSKNTLCFLEPRKCTPMPGVVARTSKHQ